MNTKIVFLGALLFAGNSIASNHENPWYAGARIGATHYSDFSQNLSTNDGIDDDNFGGGLFLGYNFNDWFALETGYTHLGKIETDNDADISHQALELVGKFTWQATESVDLFAKAGIFAAKSKGSDQLSGFDDTSTNGTLGLGSEYHFTENFSARLEYQFYNGLTLDDKGYDADWDTHLVALGLVYSWGKPDAIVIQDAPVTEAVKAEPVIVEVAEKKAIEVENQTAQIYFDTSSNTITAESAKQLQPIISHLKDHPAATIVAVGHADSRGSEENNQKLSEQRAEALSNYLIKEYSIQPERIAYSGEGELSPIADNNTKEGQAKNRRVSVFSPSFFVVEE